MPRQSLTGLLAGALVLSVLAGCRHKQPDAAYVSLGASDRAVRDAFNAGVGKVRLVVLVAPT